MQADRGIGEVVLMNGILGLKKTIAAITRKQKASKTESTIQRGKVSGDFVYTKGRSYPYEIAVDVNIKDGMYVWCEIYKNAAVIVGV